MTAAGQFDFPVDVRVGDFGGNGFGVADAGAVRPSETGPFLRHAVERASCRNEGHDASSW